MREGSRLIRGPLKQISHNNVNTSDNALAERSPLLLRVLIRHRVEGRMRVHRTESAGDTASRRNLSVSKVRRMLFRQRV